MTIKISNGIKAKWVFGVLPDSPTGVSKLSPGTLISPSVSLCSVFNNLSASSATEEEDSEEPDLSMAESPESSM
ncbi:unnamed protein product [Ambrosiozyma monospora]|uniref:Unnamed protein product n=1 Tax=Ambrosiozyma monospora TaxID=43982 RepID=A0ACB5U6Y5_AMBMO|nr:unnamed protein product [Ambrosiozyma monospora]